MFRNRTAQNYFCSDLGYYVKEKKKTIKMQGWAFAVSAESWGTAAACTGSTSTQSRSLPAVTVPGAAVRNNKAQQSRNAAAGAW